VACAVILDRLRSSERVCHGSPVTVSVISERGNEPARVPSRDALPERVVSILGDVPRRIDPRDQVAVGVIVETYDVAVTVSDGGDNVENGMIGPEGRVSERIGLGQLISLPVVSVSRRLSGAVGDGA